MKTIYQTSKEVFLTIKLLITVFFCYCFSLKNLQYTKKSGIFARKCVKKNQWGMKKALPPNALLKHWFTVSDNKGKWYVWSII